MLSRQNIMYTDHLGNVRHVSRSPLAGSTSIIQANNYYPFGGLLNEGDNQLYVQKKLYNGKEYDRMQGLNLYDYGARQYDPAICRFTSMDPLCEKYYHISPYAYCAGNPMKYVDPDGRDAVSIIDEENKIVTIKANYYVNTKGIFEKGSDNLLCSGYSKKDIKAMNDMISDFNKTGYVINEGDYAGYTLKFDMEFIDGGSSGECSSKAGMDYYRTEDGDISIGNVIQRNYDAYDSRLLPIDNVSQIGGITVQQNLIIMNAGVDNSGNKLDNRQNRMHEVFHTLGFDDVLGGKGIMDYSTLKINQTDINSVLKTVNNFNKMKYGL